MLLPSEPADKRAPQRTEGTEEQKGGGHGSLPRAAEPSSGLDVVNVKGVVQQRHAHSVGGPGREVTAKWLTTADIPCTLPSSGHCVKHFKTSSQLILVMPLGS